MKLWKMCSSTHFLTVVRRSFFKTIAHWKRPFRESSNSIWVSNRLWKEMLPLVSKALIQHKLILNSLLVTILSWKNGNLRLLRRKVRMKNEFCQEFLLLQHWILMLHEKKHRHQMKKNTIAMTSITSKVLWNKISNYLVSANNAQKSNQKITNIW